MQTIEFETGKKLKELGILPNGNSYFCWVKDHKNIVYIIPFQNFCLSSNGMIREAWAAYSLDEVLAMLPSCIEGYSLTIINHPPKYVCTYIETIRAFALDLLATEHENPTEAAARLLKKLNDCGHIKKEHKNPVEAAGQLLIWCIEQGYVKAEELNNANN